MPRNDYFLMHIISNIYRQAFSILKPTAIKVYLSGSFKIKFKSAKIKTKSRPLTAVWILSNEVTGEKCPWEEQQEVSHGKCHGVIRMWENSPNIQY